MITPIFSITQDNNYLYVSIRAPNARITETEVQFEDNDFTFFSKPYYLRLTFSSKVIENGEETTEYDSNTGTFVVKVPKLTKGQHFDDLDLLTKLLSANTKSTLNKRALIEVISGQTEISPDLIDEDFDWHFEQTLRHESEDLQLLGNKYGFANNYSGVVARIVEEFNDVIDIRDPELKSSEERKRERLEKESLDFTDDHYLSDLYDQKDVILNIIKFNVIDTKAISNEFTEDDRFKLKNLPKKEYIMEKSIKKKLLLSMIDILFAYVYDMRVNECEHNVESAWNVCKLSTTLSWFDSFVSIKPVLVSSMRRSLCYPLYRHWDLSLKVLEDTIRIVSMGQNCILKCFLDIHKMFNESGDGRYLLNDLYITDYCVWLQYLKPNTFDSLATALKNININKCDIDFDLTVLESAAIMAIEEQNIKQLNNLKVNNHLKIESISESDVDSEEFMHQTSSECSSPTTETTFSSDDKNIDIDSDDDLELNTNNISESNLS